jgi:hypothetical protein
LEGEEVLMIRLFSKRRPVRIRLAASGSVLVPNLPNASTPPTVPWHEPPTFRDDTDDRGDGNGEPTDRQ